MKNKEQDIDLDYVVGLRQKCFELLDFIIEEQIGISKNIKKGGNVTDWPLYLQKCNARLSALKDARATIDTLIKNIDNHTDLKEKIDMIESALKDKEDKV